MAENNLNRAALFAEKSSDILDHAITLLKKNGMTDIDLHGLLNCRRSLAHLAKRVQAEKTHLLPW